MIPAPRPVAHLHRIIGRLRGPGARTGRTAGAGIASAFAIQIGLLGSGIMLARTLGPGDRGEVALITLLPLILAQVGTLGMPLSVTYAIARNGRFLESVSRITWRACWIQSAVLVTACSAVLLPLIWDHGGPSRLAAVVAIAVIPAQLVSQTVLAILQGHQRASAYYVLRASVAGGNLLLLLALLLVDGLDLVTATASYTAAVVVCALLCVLTLRRTVAPTPAAAGDWEPSTRWMLGFGLRGMLGTVPIVNAYRLDQAMIGLLLPPATLGLYVVAISFTNLPRFMATSLGAMAYPHVASQADHAKALQAIWRYLAIALVACALVTLPGIVFASALVDLLFGPQFHAAAALTQVLLVSGLIVAAQRVLVDGARGLNRPAVGTLSELTFLGTLLPLAALLIPVAGVEGVAWGMVAAAGCGCAVALAGVLRSPKPGESAGSEVVLEPQPDAEEPPVAPVRPAR